MDVLGVIVIIVVIINDFVYCIVLYSLFGCVVIFDCIVMIINCDVVVL